MSDATDVKSLSDDELLRRLSDLMRHTRRIEADLVAHIGEVDERRLYLREGTASMFDYCRRVLGLRENEAYLRITVARAARVHPMLLPMLRDGRLHLSGIAKLARHLTRENRDAVVARAAGMSHRQIKELVAELEPKPDVPPTIRKLREPSAGAVPPLGAHRVVPSPGDAPIEDPARPDRAAHAPSPLAELGMHRVDAATAPPKPPPAPPRPVLEPLSPARYRVQFTASAELRDKLERLQELMRSSVPDGDLAAVIEIAVTQTLTRLESRRFGRTTAPRKTPSDTPSAPSTRDVPAAVRRAVYERDEGRCTYVSRAGRRCGTRTRLELHHDGPFGQGGDHSVSNVRLLCRPHNAMLAELDYGKEKMGPYRRPAGRRSASLLPPTLLTPSG